MPDPGWRKRALAVRERGRWRTAHGRAPPSNRHAVGGVLAACVAVIATVMASRGHAEPDGGEGGGQSPGR